MKKLAGILLLGFILAGCKMMCGMPNLEGTWKVTGYGHHKAEKGFANAEAPTGEWIVEKQEGRYFHGTRTYTPPKKKTVKEGFSGVISKCNRRIYIRDHSADVVIGDITGCDELTFYMLGKGTAERKNVRAGMVELKKVK